MGNTLVFSQKKDLKLLSIHGRKNSLLKLHFYINFTCVFLKKPRSLKYYGRNKKRREIDLLCNYFYDETM